MVRQGVAPDVVTYNLVIDAVYKAGAIDKAELVLRQMVDDGVVPKTCTYNSIIHGYSSQGHWKEAVRVFKEMASQSVTPDELLIDFLCPTFANMEEAKKPQRYFIPWLRRA